MTSEAIESTTNKGSSELSPALEHLLELHLPQRFPGSYSQEKVSQQEAGQEYNDFTEMVLSLALIPENTVSPLCTQYLTRQWEAGSGLCLEFYRIEECHRVTSQPTRH